ncbi:MAG: hypothetical protein WD845_13620 [Pirellulales bacterium]
MISSQAAGVLWLGGLAFATAMLFGASALWAVGGRGNLVSRMAPAALLLAALTPIGAYELIAVFGTEVAVVIGWLLLGRFIRARRSERNRGQLAGDAPNSAPQQIWREGPRFQLRELLQFVLLAAVILAIVRFAAPVVAATGGSVNWGVCILTGFVVGIATIAIEWIVFGNAGWYFRVPAVVLVTAAFVVSLQYIEGMNVLVAAACGVAMAAAMTLPRTTGWAWWRKSSEAGEPVTNGTIKRPSPQWLRWPARAVVSLALGLGLAMVIRMYWLMLPPPVPATALPNPNGYDELLAAASAMNWSAVPSQDHDAASADACRKFVLDNAGLLARVRESFAKPSQVPIRYDPTFMATNLRSVQLQRELCRALVIEAKLADAEGRQDDAAAANLTMLQLGNASASGGLLVHDLVGMAIGGVGLQGMASTLPKLDAAQLATVRRELQESTAAHVPIEQFFERERIFARLSMGWPGAIWLWMDEASFEPTFRSVRFARQRYDTLLHLVLTEAAVRQYALEHGEPPESLARLVPQYLSHVPDDPLGDGPLTYRRTDSGYLLYSVGRNGRDDGGLRATNTPAVTNGASDLFFDAPEN